MACRNIGRRFPAPASAITQETPVYRDHFHVLYLYLERLSLPSPPLLSSRILELKDKEIRRPEGDTLKGGSVKVNDLRP